MGGDMRRLALLFLALLLLVPTGSNAAVDVRKTRIVVKPFKLVAYAQVLFREAWAGRQPIPVVRGDSLDYLPRIIERGGAHADSAQGPYPPCDPPEYKPPTPESCHGWWASKTYDIFGDGSKLLYSVYFKVVFWTTKDNKVITQISYVGCNTVPAKWMEAKPCEPWNEPGSGASLDWRVKWFTWTNEYCPAYPTQHDDVQTAEARVTAPDLTVSARLVLDTHWGAPCAN